MRRTIVLATATVTAVGTLLAGCGSEPSRLGAAAIVGDTTVSLDHVQDWFDRVTADRESREKLRLAGQFDPLGRNLATEAVRHELLRWVASAQELDYNEAAVTELLDDLGGPEAAAADATARYPAADGSLVEIPYYDADTVRDRARDQLIALELGRKYFESTAITFDFTSARTRSDALAAAEELAAADPDEVARIIERDIQDGLQAEAGRRMVLAEDSQIAVQIPLFRVREGDVIAFTVGDAMDQWWIARVYDISYDESASGSPIALGVDQVDQRVLQEVGFMLLAGFAADVEVTLNPRYGVWDPVGLRAEPSEDELRYHVVRAGD